MWHVVFPAARPAMAVLGMLMFVQSWNDFLWPFLVLTQNGGPTVQVALAGLGRGYTPDQSLIMAGALLGTLPLLLGVRDLRQADRRRRDRRRVRWTPGGRATAVLPLVLPRVGLP
ncbi:hypothetical protein STENM327S_05176 [Streptomyces tendae]